MTSNTLSVTEDDSLILICSVIGSYPASQVEWLKGSLAVVSNDRISISGQSELNEDTQLYNTISTLSIDDTVTSDSGTYVCRTLPYPLNNSILPSVMDSLAIDVTSEYRHTYTMYIMLCYV